MPTNQYMVINILDNTIYCVLLINLIETSSIYFVLYNIVLLNFSSRV